MKIQISELGAVKEANINLGKSLTVFCGQNNTGKTYLTYIIYALTKVKFGRNPIKINIPHLIDAGEYTLALDVEQIFNYRNKVISDLKSNLDTIFGISEDIVGQMFSKFDVSFDSSMEDFHLSVLDIEINNMLSVNKEKFRISKLKGSLDFCIALVEGEDYSNLLKEEVFELFFSSIIAHRIAFYPISDSVVFPVERNSIFTFSRELSISRNFLIDQMQKLSKGEKLNPFEYIQNSTNRYPMAIRDGLTVSNDLQTIQKNKSEFYDLAVEMEEKLLNGTLSVNKDGDPVFVSKKNKGTKLPIHMTGSIVKTLSSLVFHLKYVARFGELLIIDEPEMNLHPDSQIILTRIFAKLLNIGTRLLISTHSDYIIRELNNLIMASVDKPAVRLVSEKLSYHRSETIDPNHVACYYFHFAKPSAKQVVVKEIIVDKAGFEVESIDDEISAQNERAMELSVAINKEC